MVRKNIKNDSLCRDPGGNRYLTTIAALFVFTSFLLIIGSPVEKISKASSNLPKSPKSHIIEKQASDGSPSRMQLENFGMSTADDKTKLLYLQTLIAHQNPPLCEF